MKMSYKVNSFRDYPKYCAKSMEKLITFYLSIRFMFWELEFFERTCQRKP